MSRPVPVVLSLFLLPFAVASAHAQQTEQIVISASRVPEAESEAGSAVSVIDAATLEQRQISTVFEALRETPGIAVSRSGTLGSLSEIRMRGGEANHTLVLIDGVPANDPAASSEFNFAHLMSEGIQRIEVLRGPQSALWGADAVSGVINIVTVQPEPGVFARSGIEEGSFATRQVSGLFNAGGADYGVVADGLYLKSGNINIAQTGSERDPYENLTLGARGFVNLAPNVTVSASFRHINGNTDYDSGFPVPVDTNDYTEAAQSYGRAQVKATFMAGALDVISGTTLTRTRSSNFSSGVFANALDGGRTGYDIAANLRWSGTGLGAAFEQRLSVLAETSRETFRQHYAGLASADQHDAVAADGVAAEYWTGIANAVFISLGARHDWNRRFADSTTWRTTVSATLSDRARVHASAGTGVKNPDFYELYGFVPSTFTGNPALKPERSLGYDAGVEMHFFADALDGDVTYFRADLEDEIYTDYGVHPNTARNRAGRSKRQGVEATLSARLNDSWSLTAAYTYTESTDASGAAELRRPHHIGSLELDYRFAHGRGRASIGADYTGAQRDTDFSTYRIVTLPAYTLVRLAGAYDLGDGLTVTARIENALDTHYEEVLGYRTRGFGAFVGLRAAFGG